MSKLQVDKISSDNPHIIFGGKEQLDLSSSPSDIILPRGTTAQRPTTVANGLVPGGLYFNTDYNVLQYFTGWEWRGIDGSRDYSTDGIAFYIDAANPESFTKENIFSKWIYYSTGASNSNRLVNNGVHLYNNSTGWVGYFQAKINTAVRHYIEFEVWATEDNTVLVLDNDGVDNNAFNRSITVGTAVETKRYEINFTTTGSSEFFFRRDSGGDIWMTNVRLYSARTDEIKNVGSVNTHYGETRAKGGLTWSPDNYGVWVFDGSDDFIELPDFDRGDPLSDSTTTENGDSFMRSGPNFLSISMEMVIKQVGTNKSLEIFGTSNPNSSHPDSGFAYFPASQGFFFYRFVNAGGDRPHIKATTSVNLTDGNWHHFIGTFDQQTGYARLYRNGNLVSESNTTTLSSSYQGNFGGNATSYAFNGNMGLARIYSRALTAVEVKRNFDSIKFRYGL